MKIRLAKLADRDLRLIYRYSYEEFGEARAEEYYWSLWDCLRLLAEFPGIGRLRTELHPPLRSHHHQRHIVFYDVADDHVFIVRILHERMAAERHLGYP